MASTTLIENRPEYFVVRDMETASGIRIINYRLSRSIDRLSTLRRVLKRIQRTVPDARGIEVRSF